MLIKNGFLIDPATKKSGNYGITNAASWYLCGLYRNTDWMLCLSQEKAGNR